jgi:channel protein (hemolysin III family)
LDSWYNLPGFYDPLSSISHLAGAVIYLVMSGFLLGGAWWDRKRFWSCAVFVLAALTLLSLSSVFHMMAVGGTPRAVMLRLDVAAIFVLIAGTFTPIHVILFRGWNRWGILLLLWTIVVAGVTLRTIYFEEIPRAVGSGIFLLMGWIGGYSGFLISRELGWRRFRPVLWGGICYSIGAVLNIVEWPVIIPMVWGPHETFHFFVLAALGFHWSFIASISSKPRLAPLNPLA